MGRNILSRTLLARTDRQLELGVEVGQVMCPAQGIVDVERCFTCPSYRGLRDGPDERLVCAPATDRGLITSPFGFIPR